MNYIGTNFQNCNTNSVGSERDCLELLFESGEPSSQEVISICMQQLQLMRQPSGTSSSLLRQERTTTKNTPNEEKSSHRFGKRKNNMDEGEGPLRQRRIFTLISRKRKFSEI